MSAELTPSGKVAGTIVNALQRCGVTRVAFCPGSRNAPFAYALAQSDIHVEVFADERVAAFWALGVARAALGCAVFTTSGTAAAELHPAIEEAKHRGLTLIAITADRPYELRGVAANQTTDQIGLYGSSVDLESVIPADDPTPSRLASIAGMVDRCVAHPGPSHLNVSFREPLTPGNGAVPTLPEPPKRYAGKQVFPEWRDVVDPNLNTVIVAGDGADVSLLEADVPILAEPSANAPKRVDHVPLLLEALQAEVQQIVVTGKPTLTRGISALLARGDVRKIVVGRKPHSDASSTAKVIVPGLSNVPVGDTRTTWDEASEAVEALLTGTVDGDLNLLSAARAVWDGSNGPLWLGPSNTIRAFDLAAFGVRQHVYSPRGLAGIDGNIAQPLGLASTLGTPIRVVMGDLTFNYDLNALTAQTNTDAQIIVLDDGGGSIFASLEHGEPEYAHLYEKFFAAKQNLDIAAAARACGWRSRVLTSIEELHKCVQDPIQGREVVVVPISRPACLIHKVKLAAQQILGF